MEKNWIKYAFVFVGFCLIFVVLKCKSNPIITTDNTTSTEEKKIEESVFTDNLPSSFMDFYERFHNEESYQMEHILFPLKGQQQDGNTMEVTAVKWEEDQWVLHKPFNSHGGTFKREYSNFNGIIIEDISDSSGTFSMQRRYSQISGEWNLIYYSTFQMKPENNE